MKKKRNKDRQRSTGYYFARYSGLGFEMLGIIVFGVWGGHKLDSYSARQFPLWTVIFSLMAVFIALYLVIKDLITHED